MMAQSSKTHVHFELASFAEPRLLLDLVDNILPFADSLGMNEQVSNALFTNYKITRHFFKNSLKFAGIGKSEKHTCE